VYGGNAYGRRTNIGSRDIMIEVSFSICPIIRILSSEAHPFCRLYAMCLVCQRYWFHGWSFWSNPTNAESGQPISRDALFRKIWWVKYIYQNITINHAISEPISEFNDQRAEKFRRMTDEEQIRAQDRYKPQFPCLLTSATNHASRWQLCSVWWLLIHFLCFFLATRIG
jgi:hypothetical protein